MGSFFICVSVGNRKADDARLADLKGTRMEQIERIKTD